MTTLNWFAFDIGFALIIVALLAVTLILIMDCIWRTEGKFDKYLKLIATAFVFLLIKNILFLFGFDAYQDGGFMIRTLEVFSVIFFLFSNIELYIIIRALSGEKNLK